MVVLGRYSGRASAAFAFKTMAEKRVRFSCKLKPVTKAALQAEAKARGLSQGKLLDDLVLDASRSTQALAVIAEYAKKDPLNVVLAEAAARTKPLPKPKRGSGK